MTFQTKIEYTAKYVRTRLMIQPASHESDKTEKQLKTFQKHEAFWLYLSRAICSSDKAMPHNKTSLKEKHLIS